MIHELVQGRTRLYVYMCIYHSRVRGSTAPPFIEGRHIPKGKYTGHVMTEIGASMDPGVFLNFGDSLTADALLY